MKTHELKTDPEVFDAVKRGDKCFEIRYNDRDFQVGDCLCLQRTRYTGLQMKNGEPLEYTGEQEEVCVTYILHGPVYGLATGWVIMSITPFSLSHDTRHHPSRPAAHGASNC